MHGCNPGSTLLVNAEVDSMGGVIDSGVGISHKTSPHRAAIEKVRAELRQEYDVREERRRELEFLEKGGNPLDFKFGNAASVSVQSTSLTDQHHELFVTSEAKGSFALTASPHGDSVESSGRPGAPSVCEPNSSDNLLLFDGDNESLEVEKNSVHLSRINTINPSEQSSQMKGSQNAKESDDSAIFRPYARRNRTRTKRDYSHVVSKDAKGLPPETTKQRDLNLPPNSKLKPVSSNGDIASKDQASTKSTFMELDGGRPNDVSGVSIPDDKLHAVLSRSFKEEERNIPSQDCIVPGDTDVSHDHANAEDREQVRPANPEHPRSAAAVKSEIEAGFRQPNGFSSLTYDRKGKLESAQFSSVTVSTKGLDLGSSYTQTSVGVDVNNDSDICIDTDNIVSNGDSIEKNPELEKELILVRTEMLKETNENNTAGSAVDDNNDQSSRSQNYSFSSGVVKSEDDLLVSCSVMQELKDPSDIKGMQQNENSFPKSDIKEESIFCELPKSDVEQLSEKHVLVESSNPEIPQTTTTEGDATAAPDSLAHPADCLKLADKAHEDSILEEACIIQAKRKRIAELSVRTLPPQNCGSSHWDFVVEEMGWLANDFSQERLWKLSAASQLCRQAAFASRKRLERKTTYWKMKSLAHDIAKSVMQFWHRAELLLDSDYVGLESSIVSSGGVWGKGDMPIKSEDLDGQHPNKSVQGYAVSFLKYNRSLISSPQAGGPATPDRISCSYAGDLLCGVQFTEEALFYMVPATAMEVYRKSIESHFPDEKIGTSAQEEVETSTHYAMTEFGSEELYEMDEGEPSIHYMPGAFERNKSSKYAKKQKALLKSHTPRISEVGIDLAYGHCMAASPRSTMIGKRPGSLHVGLIPTKRMRTANRQRVLTPFGPGVTGAVHAQNKTDASSGDTDSFQDDQSTLHGGSQMQKSMEVESVGEFDKHLSYDYAETSIKSRKKKKAKHMGSAYDQGWQMDSAVYSDQKDHSKRRLDSHYFESHGTSGLSPHHIGKKPKRMNKSVETTYDNVSPSIASIPSPAVSHMSNMPNQNRLIKLITGSGRDKARKPKTLKMSAVQPTTGIPWSLFEDQALVVLVHDMGPNWELISDAMNSTLHFKCIFRKPNECKERHKNLMERSSGDGADSADDSGSSQSYPSTLPGIPKGSARQLFQRLQGPMEEDTLKSHFDKIIKLGQKQHLQKNQNGNQDPKQIVPAHSSHAASLSKVADYEKGVVLTPLDLADATESVPDILPQGCQGTHGNGLTLLNQGPSLPTSGVNSTIQGPSSMVVGNNSPSPSGQVAASMRDSQHGFSRASLPIDERQRLQKYNQMLSRNIQQSALSVPSSLLGSDRGVCMLPGGNGIGMMCGISRSMPVSRPGFQGMASSSMLSSGSMISTSMVGIASPVNMHSGAGPAQGNSILRPRDALHVMRPGHNPEHQRQMVPDLHMQVTQINNQGVHAFNGSSSAINNQTTPGTVQSFPGHDQQKQSHLSSPHHSHLQGTNNASNSQQKVYAIRLAKERQLQQRYLQHQHQFAASSTLMPPGQIQSQLALSSSLQNSSPIQSQGSPQPMSPPAVTPSSPLTSISSQPQQKRNLPQHGISRTAAASGLSNQAVKQLQKQAQQQQFQQPSRQHPNQWQHAHSQQQAKLLKGIGRGTMAVHQNIPVDPCHHNGISIPPGIQTGDKGDQIAQIMQGQSLYSGSCLNSSQPSKPFVPQPSNHTQLQQRVHSPTATTSLKQVQQPMPPDSCSQSQVSLVPPDHVLPTTSSVVSSAVTSNHQLLQMQPQSQSLQTRDNENHPSGERVLHQSRLLQSESPNISQAGPSQVEQKTAKANQVTVGSPLVQMNITDSMSSNPSVSEPRVSEPSLETNTLNSTAKVGLLGGPLVFPEKEPTSPTNHGLGPKQLSVSLPPHVRNTVGLGQQQQLQTALHQMSAHHLTQQSIQTSEQQDQQQEKDQPSPKHMTSHHHPKEELQAAQNNFYRGPPNSEVE